MKNVLDSAFFNQDLRYFGMEEIWKIFQKIRMNTVNNSQTTAKPGLKRRTFLFSIQIRLFLI